MATSEVGIDHIQKQIDNCDDIVANIDKIVPKLYKIRQQALAQKEYVNDIQGKLLSVGLDSVDGNKIATYWLLKTYKSLGQAKSIYIDKTDSDNITYTYDTVAMMEDLPLDDSLGPKEQGTCILED